jgi:hypothetical protein
MKTLLKVGDHWIDPDNILLVKPSVSGCCEVFFDKPMGFPNQQLWLGSTDAAELHEQLKLMTAKVVLTPMEQFTPHQSE